MTCTRCNGKGYTSAPYIWPDISTITACTCEAGRKMIEELKQKGKKDDGV